MTSPEQTAATYAASAAAKAFGTDPGFFQHGTHRQNTLESHEQTPQVFLFDPRPQQAAQDSRTVRLACTMYFVDAEPGDGDNEEAGTAAIARMSSLKDKFFAHLDKNPLLDIQTIEWESVRQIYQSRFTGVAVRFVLVVPRPAGYVVCVSQEPDPLVDVFDKTFSVEFH